MAYRYEFLAKDPFPRIHQTFREAFADYYIDASDITEQILFNRAVKNGVDFGLSVGTFEGERMVGVTIVGTDRWKDAAAAYDIGTGIIPAHRGKGIARKMFDFAVPKLRETGVERFVLEVIQENEPAIKAYTAVGFRVTREFDCFRWNFDLGRPLPTAKRSLEIRTEDRSLLDDLESHLDWQPSWENSFASIRRIPDDVVVYGAPVDGVCAGLLVYYPLLNWITTLVVRKDQRRKGVASDLLSHFAEKHAPEVPYVKLANVDHTDTATLSLLKKAGFEPDVRQFEMELEL